MFSSRLIERGDEQLLNDSLQRDSFHNGTMPAFFYDIGTICNVYEDEEGPVLFCRGAKALRLDIQYVNNLDIKRNRQMMLEGFPAMEAKAKAAGFTEIIFFSNSSLLTRFCKQTLGFRDVAGELRKLI